MSGVSKVRLWYFRKAVGFVILHVLCIFTDILAVAKTSDKSLEVVTLYSNAVFFFCLEIKVGNVS